MSQTTDDTKKTQQKSKRPYKVPQLINYGALKDLTAAGSGKRGESSYWSHGKRVYYGSHRK